LELRNHKRKLQALLHFDPHHVLQDLYRLQGMLDGVWFPYDQTPPDQHGAPPARYSADDAWEGNVSDDEDDLAEEITYLAMPKVSKGKVGSAKLKATTNNKDNTTQSKVCAR